jgi:hypothetical protein
MIGRTIAPPARMMSPRPAGVQKTTFLDDRRHGVTMLAAILKSSRAIQMSIRIVRAFVQLREMLAAHRDLAIRMDRLEQEQQNHASVINILADEIDALKLPPADPPKRQIRFQALASISRR